MLEKILFQRHLLIARIQWGLLRSTDRSGHWLFVGTLYFTVYCVRASDGIVSVSNDICDLSSRNLV